MRGVCASHCLRLPLRACVDCGLPLPAFFCVSRSLLSLARAPHRRLATAIHACRDDAATPAAALGGLLFTCCGRGERFYGRPQLESSIFSRRFPNAALTGFFCGGEIGPAAIAAAPRHCPFRLPASLQVCARPRRAHAHARGTFPFAHAPAPSLPPVHRPAATLCMRQGFTAVFGVFFVPLPEKLTRLSLCSALAHPASGAAAVIRWRESAPLSRLQS